MRKIPVAVIGVGALGEHHAATYSRLEEADLVGVVDVREERARQVAERLGTRAFTDYRRILDRVEAVSLAVPTRLHAALGVEVLRRGLHLLVEKPIAHSLEAADRMIEARDASGSVFHVGHSERFNPAFRAVRPLLTSPRFFEAHRLGVFVPRSLDVDVVLDLMIHDIDLVLEMTGSRLSELRAVGIPVLTGRVDIANARLEFENGSVANLTASRVSREKIRKLRLFQPHDYLSIDFNAQEVEMYGLQETGEVRTVVERRVEVVRKPPLQAEIETFLAAVRAGKSAEPGPACSGQDGKKALELALRIVRRAARKLQESPGA